MRTIIMDLEWTSACTNGAFPQNARRNTLHNEIIQIGAVALQEKKALVEETFSIDICPAISGKVKKEVVEMTGLSYDKLKRTGCRFKRALEAFKAFAGDDSLRILTWGESDQRVLEENMAFWNLKFSQEPIYIDLQSVCGQYLFPGEDRKSVENSLKALGLEPAGQFHNALSDALNETQIFAAVPDAMHALDSYNQYYFSCSMLTDLHSLRVYTNLSAELVGSLMEQEFISAAAPDERGEEVIPRFPHNGRYIRVWRNKEGYRVENTKILKNRSVLLSYHMEIGEEALEQTKVWYQTYEKKMAEFLLKSAV